MAYQIVIIEDSKELCEGWKELFELSGHRVTVHYCGRSALLDEEHLREADLLVTDYYLPDLNGIEVIRRARDLKPDLPSILLTGAKDPTLARTLEMLPQTVFLTKPIGIEELERGVCTLLSDFVN